jgi:hypothetical protein
MRLKFAGIAAALLLTLTVIAPSPRAAPNAADKAQVFVVATLYKRHESVPAYDLATLRKVILAIKPEVLVLDITPDELKNEKVWDGSKCRELWSRRPIRLGAQLTMTRENFVVSDGVKIWTTQTGEGQPVMLCNGGAGCCDYLGPVAGMLDDMARVIRLEQRGCGRSQHAPPYDVETCLLDLESVRTHYGIDRWIIGWHSWGATWR